MNQTEHMAIMQDVHADVLGAQETAEHLGRHFGERVPTAEDINDLRELQRHLAHMEIFSRARECII